MRRLDKTLADYVAIAISPALIMLMVGSLMWFLVAVFYQGSYDGRIYWILGCYVFAIVLITRIAIEESPERAAMFGMALAGAVGLATMRFSSSMYFHWILLAVAWWAAHKLTWDCTLIDEEQDASGQGLMQLVGFRKKPPEADEENGEPKAEKTEEEPADPDGVTERVERMREEAHPKRRTKGKAHTPGVWIVYFSLAALPLFGLGQMLVPVADADRRLWTFQLLCTYVAAGLGLLVTTSFVGLRRYLRQRGVQMPPQMAGVWIALGATIIIVLLAVCAILPRPAAEYQVAQMPDLPFKFTTPERESNRYAMGKEGADKNNPDSQSRTQGEQDGTKPEGGKSEDPESGGEKGSNAKEGKGNKKSSDGKSEGSKGEKKGESESKQDSSSKQQGDSSKSQDRDSSSDKEQSGGDKKQQQGERSERNQSKQEPSESKQESGEKSQSSDSQRERQENDRDSADPNDESEGSESKDPNDEEQSQTDRREQDERSDSKDRSEESREDSKSSQDRREEEEKEEKEEEQSEQNGSRSSSNQSQKPDNPPFQLPQVSLSGGLFGMLKFVVYVILACVAAWWLWKNWRRVVEGFRQFLQELRDLWASLFGGKRKSAEEGEEEEATRARPDRPFTDYVDPFSGGLASRYAPDELVRYTFEATEAWARENGCRRDPDQTPHEFAARLGKHVESLGPGSVTLAKLYCQAAYAPGSLAPRSLKPLADFWQRLRTSHGMVVPPPPPVQTPVG